MLSDTQSWWTLLRTIAALNLAAWAVSALVLVRRRRALGEAGFAARRLQVWLSAGYVAGCAWRSVLPVFDLERIVLVDSWLSSVVVGRSVATLAELCFAAQWALLLREIGEDAGSALAARAARAIVPLIAVAELCSWYAVLTLANIGHVFEESLWGLAAALWVASVLAVAPRVSAPRRALLVLWCVAGAAYVAYMFQVDVPMYWNRWVADQAAGRATLDILDGAADASRRWTVSHDWTVWRGEVVWMTLYFSAAVWASIGLVHAPVAGARPVRVPLAEPGRA